MTWSLHRYWFRWELADSDPRYAKVGGALGCGVTGVDVDDAKDLVRAIALSGKDVPRVAEVVEDVDVGTLDPERVLPVMRNPDQRGVWFPRHPYPSDFRLVHLDREVRFALEVDDDSGRCFVSFPVSNTLADYEEYYEVDRETFDRFAADPPLAHPFVARAKNRELDHLLLRPPGRDRGWA